MKGTAKGREANGIGRSLFWSATAHLLVGFALLARGTSPSAGPFRGVVDVILLGSSSENRIVEGAPVRGSSVSGSSVADLPAGGPAVSSVAIPRLTPPQEKVAGESRSLSGEAVPGIAAALAEDAPGRKDPGTAAPSPDPGAPVLAGPSPAEGGGGTNSSAWITPSGDGPPDAGPAVTPLEPGRTGEGSGAGMGLSMLRSRIQSRIVYPEEAVRRGQQGEVLLRIRIEGGGVPSEIRIARSSGVRLLDEAASRGVIRAAPLPSEPGWVEDPDTFDVIVVNRVTKSNYTRFGAGVSREITETSSLDLDVNWTNYDSDFRFGKSQRLREMLVYNLTF